MEGNRVIDSKYSLSQEAFLVKKYQSCLFGEEPLIGQYLSSCICSYTSLQECEILHSKYSTMHGIIEIDEVAAAKVDFCAVSLVQYGGLVVT